MFTAVRRAIFFIWPAEKDCQVDSYAIHFFLMEVHDH